MIVELEPRKIWVDSVLADQCSTRLHETELPYIREDIVSDLVEALEGLVERTTHICEGAYGPGMDGAFDKARAALAKARGEV